MRSRSALTHSTTSFSFLLILLLVLVSACDTSDPFAAPDINSDALEAEGGRGTAVDLTLSLQAEAGIESLTVEADGGAPENVSIQSGATQQEVTYTFTIPAESELGQAYPLVFTLTDADGVATTINATVTTGKLIDTPDTYTFTRDGASTVSYSGQDDRLDQVEAIKAYLQTADAGTTISAQVLMDMFQNTGDNGGGNFSFTSDRQLANKTFQPDRDARLFENLFERAAAASEAAAAGKMATNGQAGLIVRENSGNTILIDENGREFTQLIEKGLMGAVFYNQIFNVYLSENRIGNDVENTMLSEGKNYTAMEHHWDEAYGYFNAPVDFTSRWPSERGSEDRFWSHYSNVVDNVNANGELGTNASIMEAFREGRAAIVNNDPTTRDAQRDVLYANLELVAAATAVHYINDTLAALDAGKTGEAFHVLSEAWAFVNAIRYTPRRALSLAEIEQIMETDFGADGNFWNVTPIGLNTAKAKLVQAYPELAPIQDDL